MSQGAVDNAIEIFHQLKGHLEGETPAQGNDTPDPAPGYAIREGVAKAVRVH